MRLILVRHGETRLNREGRAQGRTSEGLNPTGRRQALDLARALRKEPVDTLYSSPLPRALETARIIGRAIGLPVRASKSLMELDMGELDGLTMQALHGRYPDLMERWRLDPASASMPGGETLANVQRRAWSWVLRVLRKHQGATAVAVTHNFVIQALLCKALGTPLSQFRRFRVDVGSMTIVRLDKESRGTRAVMLGLNSTPPTEPRAART
ncbi:MAG: histidine phosphatase family protein [Chloroflexi bacterium]|nr:histidine phosphatase family protein [Chloroflexota bacterium]